MTYREVLCIVLLCGVSLALNALAIPVGAEVERFPARDGDAIELWRITNDPLVRDHANYHNTQCWSPDGTKIAFVSTYDLKDGPATKTVEDFSGGRLVVRSTEGFPDSGRLVNPAGFGGEVLSYERKTREASSLRGIR